MLYLIKRYSKYVMANLKELFNLKEIQVGLKNLFKNQTDIEDAISKAIISYDYTIEMGIEDENKIIVPLTIDEESFSFETSLYVNEDATLYLFESRLFHEETDNMIGAYLEVLKSDLTPVDEVIDDVWDYADWNIVK